MLIHLLFENEAPVYINCSYIDWYRKLRHFMNVGSVEAFSTYEGEDVRWSLIFFYGTSVR